MKNAKDSVLTREVLVEVLNSALKKNSKTWNDNLDIRFSDFKHEVREEMDSVVTGAIFASESRMMKKMNEIKEEIIDGIGEILDEVVLPQIAELRIDVNRIKDRLQMA